MRTIKHNRTGVDSEWWVEFPRRRVRFNWKIIKASGSHAIMFFCFMPFRILSLYYSNGAFTAKRVFKTFLINFTRSIYLFSFHFIFLFSRHLPINAPHVLTRDKMTSHRRSLHTPLLAGDRIDTQRLFELFGQSAIEINWCTRVHGPNTSLYTNNWHSAVSGLTTTVSEFRECKSLNGNVNRQNYGNLRAKTMTAGRPKVFTKVGFYGCQRIEFPVLFI